MIQFNGFSTMVTKVLKNQAVRRSIGAAILSLGFVIPFHAYALGVDVIVSDKNSTITLNKEQVAAIFLDKTSTFPNGKDAVPIDSKDMAVKSVFYQNVAYKNRQQVIAYWSKLIFTSMGQPPYAVSAADIIDIVSKNPNMIGYIQSRPNKALLKGVRVVLSQ